MTYHIGIEQIEPGKWTAWIHELPGCYTKGKSRSVVIETSPHAIADFLNWRDGYTRVTESDTETIKVEVTEEFTNYYSDKDYWVNAFFKEDKRVLSEADMDEIIWLLSCTRNDLEQIIRKLPIRQLHAPIEGEKFKSLSGILKHIAGAEWWYFDKFNLACNWETLPDNVFEKLTIVRNHTLAQLPRLVNNATIIEEHEELWSARKIIRRTIWHERVHTRHLQERLQQLKSA